MLEFAGQRTESALHRALHAASGRRFRARDIRVSPYNEITLVWNDLGGYFRSLPKKMRSNISRQARRLFAAGEPELLLVDGPKAASAWFDAYCDVDRRSWKQGTQSSISRDPRRVRFYREIAAGAAGLDPGFIGIVLDGVLIAGLLMGSDSSASPGNHGAWCLEMAYDRSRAELGPGQLLLLLAVGRAIENGHRSLSFMQNFAYYKHRWAAQPIEIVNVQLIRRLSLHNVRATAGDWMRTWKAWRRPAADSRIGSDDYGDSGERNRTPLELEDQERARALTTAALAYPGTGVRRLNRRESHEYLPFDFD
jgi:CelD/BcsL family acetyltransferase involved in cellulose biosynthesis